MHLSDRYVGDMLAWLHQGVASEKELLQSLLKKVLATGKYAKFVTQSNVDNFNI